MMGFTVAALFFIRFWVRTKESLFAGFAIAFSILALERWVLFATTDGQDESQAIVYLMRAIAFLVIIVSVVAANRAQTAERH